MKSRPLVLITSCSERKGAEFLDRSMSLSDRYSRAIIAAGGLPWVLSELNVPVYATEFTLALIENKLEEHQLLDQTTLLFPVAALRVASIPLPLS